MKVITGSRQFVEGPDVGVDNPQSEGVQLIKLKSLFKKPKNIFLRIFDSIFFSLGVFIKILFSKKVDLIFVQTNPPTILIFVWLISFLKGTPYIINNWDLYPEILIAHRKLKSSIIIRIINFFFVKAYRSAKNVISLGPEMTKSLLKKGVAFERIVYIPTWATGNLLVCKRENNDLIKDWNAVARLKMVYTGNLGLAHDSIPLLKAINNCDFDKNQFQMYFVAKGKSLQAAHKYVFENNLNELIQFKEPVISSLMPKVIGLSDLGFVTIREGFQGFVNPSKVSGYLARGLPILYVGPPSDVSEIIIKYNCGFYFNHKDIDSISSFLENLSNSKIDLKEISFNAYNYYCNFLSIEKATIKIQNMTKKFFN